MSARRSTIWAALLLACAPAAAAAQAVATPPGGGGMAAMSMSGADDAATPPATPALMGMSRPMTAAGGAEGRYPMTRDASGTAWQPDSSPMDGVHAMAGDWSLMLHGYVTGVFDDQGGRRGDTDGFSESMLMGMARRPLGGGSLTLRAMASLDPLMGREGYPLLFQTGETANGRTPLVDRQHPHDLVMELAAVYTHPIARKVDGFLYVGWPGEPALGPATYMHRFSGVVNPEAPLGHHWLDSTHVTFGVVTAGAVVDTGVGAVKLEASSFTGREPNAFRWDFDHPRMDSWSVRATWNPSRDLSLQVSRGHLQSPEALEPDENQDRTTASATYNLPLALRGRRGNFQTTFAWGRDEDAGRPATDAFLLDGAASLGADTVFARVERVDKDELFSDTAQSPLAGRSFTVNAASVGYARTLPAPGRSAVDLGGLVSRYVYPRALDAAYGSDPTSFLVFARVKLR